MKAWEVVGYKADAQMWCPECFAAAGYTDPGEDGEGNPTHPIFAVDEASEDYCGECHEALIS